MVFFFFFKQKTAYEIYYGLVGSEMCIRGRLGTVHRHEKTGVLHGLLRVRQFTQDDAHILCTPCLLYTSDAADDLLCVDLGGRRIIYKKNYVNATLPTPLTSYPII